MGWLDNLICLFSARIEHREEKYILEVPESELSQGNLQPNETYRVGLLPAVQTDQQSREPGRQQTESTDIPVRESERRDVEIDDIGSQGDGLTRIDQGYIVIVPDTQPGERVTIEITDVRPNMAFAEVVDRHSYPES